MPYAAFADPYCYQHSTVLKNIPGIRDQPALTAYETVHVIQRADEPLPDGYLSASHYRTIHRHLFQDVYRWAGRYRTVRLSKSSSMFCYPENIAAETRKLFARFRKARYLRHLPRDQFIAGAAAFLAQLNAIHPFREGNGRSQLTFMTLVAAQAGHPFDLERLEPERFLHAMVRSFSGDELPLRREMGKLIRRSDRQPRAGKRR